jgi:hypothetical protein
MSLKRRLLAGIVTTLLALLTISNGQAQSGVIFHNLAASHVFGESLHFEAEVAASETISQLELFFKPAGGSSVSAPVSISNGTHLSAEYEINTYGGFPPFIEIDYWFVSTTASGRQVQSETETFIYTDNRYTWRTLDYGVNYHAYWVDGDTSFGQAILDAAVNSFTYFDQYLNLPIPETLDLYIYPSADSLQSALEINGASWKGGHADPGGMRAYAVIPNSYDYILDMGNKIPHEITHIRLWLKLGDGYNSLPIWLNEGLATLSERFPPDDSPLLNAAFNQGSLYGFNELCASFPGDAGGAAVAYAQSESLVRYIYNRFGKLGLQTLAEAYGAGHSCQNGVVGSLGVTLDELEEQWYGYQFGQREPAASASTLASILGWSFIGAIIFLSPLALIVFSRRRREEEEKPDGE